MVIEIDRPTLFQSLLSVAPLETDVGRSWDFLRSCGVLPDSARETFFAVVELEATQNDDGALPMSLRVEAPLYAYVTAAGDQQDPDRQKAVALWHDYCEGKIIRAPPTNSLIMRIGEFLTGARSSSPRPSTARRARVPTNPPLLAKLARESAWGAIVAETDGASDLQRLKLRAYALYVRRIHSGVSFALEAVSRVCESASVSDLELFYATMMRADLEIASGASVDVWSASLKEARRLADTGVLESRDAYDDFVEAARKLEIGNTQMTPPAGALLERLGFWTSIHLRRFFGFSAPWELAPVVTSQPKVTSGSFRALMPIGEALATLSKKLNEAEKQRLSGLVYYLESLSEYVGKDKSDPFPIDQLHVVRWGIRDHGGTEVLDHLLDLLAEEVVSPKDLLSIRSLVKSCLG